MADDTPWEPPLAGTESEHLLGALDRLRTTFRWKADGLDAAGLQARIGASSLTIGGLLKHLAAVEDYTFTTKLRGERLSRAVGIPRARRQRRLGVHLRRRTTAPALLYALWDAAVARSRERVAAALAEGGLDQPADIASPEGEHASLRRLLFDLVEEYGRHTGHADLLRESVDGRVGEDPPPGWRAGG